jgi:flavin reductase (DIM6/NTAB) family NADH-FMN oxidoreductase RutF
MTRVEFDPGQMSARDFYKLMTSSIVPRPIAWVSTRSADGVDNLAPHSFFTVSCVDPPVLQFTSVGLKDSQRNIEETGEFVVNFAPEALFEQINATASDFPPEISEFEAAGIAAEPSSRVGPLRVAESPIAFECRLVETISFGDSTVIFGRVLAGSVDEDVIEDGLPAIERLRPMARLGKIEWMEPGPIRRTTRIPYGEWPGHYRGAADGESP